MTRTILAALAAALLLSACQTASPTQSSPPEAFAVVQDDTSTTIRWNTEVEIAFEVQGDPVFPVEAEYIITGTCDTRANFSCDSTYLLLEEEQDPIEITHGCFCRGHTCGNTYVHEGIYRFTDATGAVAESDVRTWTCTP